MLGEILFRKSALPAVMKSLDASMLRSRVIANNIANIDTPGFRRVEVNFEDALRTAVDKSRLTGSRTSEKHMAMGRKDLGDVNPYAYRPVDPTLASGVNNVDIDVEMAKLAENQIQFNFGVSFVKGAYTKMNSAIQGKSLPVK